MWLISVLKDLSCHAHLVHYISVDIPMHLHKHSNFVTLAHPHFQYFHVRLTCCHSYLFPYVFRLHINCSLLIAPSPTVSLRLSWGLFMSLCLCLFQWNILMLTTKMITAKETNATELLLWNYSHTVSWMMKNIHIRFGYGLKNISFRKMLINKWIH